MKKLVIFGGSGIGMIAASVARDLGNWEIVGFLNDAIPVGEKIGKYQKFDVIGRSLDYRSFLNDDNVYYFMAYVGMQDEQNVMRKLMSLEIPASRWASLIHPTAIVPKGMCNIGSGVLLSPLSQLSVDTTIEDNCILLPNSFLGHDSTMQRFSHLATNSVVGANVTVGRAVHVGSNATIREKIKIGDFSLVGAGSVVIKDVPENSIVVGNPAKILRMK